MKIKRQKQIRTFLMEEFGEARGGALFETQDQILGELISGIKSKSESQKKTLIQTILPSIALYKGLFQEGFPEEEVTRYVQKYMFEKVGAGMHASMSRMEKIPGFYFLYSSIFRKIMQGSDSHESTQSHTRDSFDVTITRCLWHTACAENGCEKMCRIFCDADNVTYGGLRKLGFSRTRTLGYGDDCCDFHFFRK